MHPLHAAAQLSSPQSACLQTLHHILEPQQHLSDLLHWQLWLLIALLHAWSLQCSLEQGLWCSGCQQRL